MLSSEGDAEAEAYATFSLDCLQRSSPPGSCGDSCDASNFLCRSNEMRLACCAEDGECIDTHTLSGAQLGVAGRFQPPRGCGYECSLVLPAFVEACAPYMRDSLQDDYPAADLAQFATAAQQCENQDPVDILNVLYEKKYAANTPSRTKAATLCSVATTGPRRWLCF
eukprot:SAG31_NODE_1490_length_8134_cov_3.892968_2_plen_167_part_00